jgi:hypothetical protein
VDISPERWSGLKDQERGFLRLKERERSPAFFVLLLAGTIKRGAQKGMGTLWGETLRKVT